MSTLPTWLQEALVTRDPAGFKPVSAVLKAAPASISYPLLVLHQLGSEIWTVTVDRISYIRDQTVAQMVVLRPETAAVWVAVWLQLRGCNRLELHFRRCYVYTDIGSIVDSLEVLSALTRLEGVYGTSTGIFGPGDCELREFAVFRSKEVNGTITQSVRLDDPQSYGFLVKRYPFLFAKSEDWLTVLPD
ncbi:MAG: hypothetical protein CEO22_693 [Candidatus Berkelbacteria bacterium Gr01-1014_85]|uniref:Uncharacterized protein n=1 Tax=Candidatus Berkelbacteria bacterium Gr01-1014_85 TaxID=2017150 RepID=A0A554J8X8_9BACT|nr:MAG: hypothetical protein CEO22_693 [Candidatus Berkelbacteria bacterium Gr01-1014_85]